MKKFFKILYEITVDAFATFILFIENNLLNFANVLNLLLPFVMYFIAGGNLSWKLIIPVIVFTLIYYARNIANKVGKGITVPIPEKRFTEVDDEGEVSVEHKRLQEMLLYVADLEDWLERKGLL